MIRVALALLLVTGIARAQPAHLDPSALPQLGAEAPEVLLVTFGVGERIFERFGHAALCVRHAGHEATCFNYGVTDFAAIGDLVWGFLRGEQKFWVEAESWSSMTWFYEHEDRDIWVQQLPLAPDQAREIEHKLVDDVQQRRSYNYDHFFDNCTTRLRDIIDRATGGRLHVGANVDYPLTFREIGHRGIAVMPELIALTDFLLGRQLDDTPTLWDAMFHPSVLRQQVELALGAKPKLVNKRAGPPFPTSGSTGRLQMLLIALVFALPLFAATLARKLETLALAWATLYLVFWGLVVWTLAIVSSIPGIRWNEVVLVMMPLDVVLPFLGYATRRRYARVRLVGLLLLSALGAIGVFHQPLWIPILSAFMPLATVAFRDELQAAVTRR